VAEPDPTWDWNDFVATAQALTSDQDGDGATDIYGLGSEASLVRMAPFVWMNGGDVVDDPAAPTRLTLDAPPTLAALAWFIDLQLTHQVMPSAVAEEAESSLSRFLNGRLAMFIDSRRAVPEFRTIQGFDWDVAPLPEGEQRASVLHADAYCMAAAGRQKAATWRFVEYANTLAGQTILARTGRTVPSRVELATSPIFLDPQAKPAHSRVFIDAIAGIRNLPGMATWSDIEGVVDKELEQAFYGQITLEEAIRNAETRSAEFFRPP
jgi:multiple sugar transport system substrate-binding protein